MGAFGLGRVVVEGSGKKMGRPGAFFETCPRHRTLISINKVHTGSDDPEFNLRHDWNSILSDGCDLLFKEFSTAFFPPADTLLAYHAAYVGRHGVRVRYDTRVTRVSRQGDTFLVESAAGERFSCTCLVVATGVSRPYIPPIPGIEPAERYEDVSVDPADFANQRVLRRAGATLMDTTFVPDQASRRGRDVP